MELLTPSPISLAIARDVTTVKVLLPDGRTNRVDVPCLDPDAPPAERKRVVLEHLRGELRLPLPPWTEVRFAQKPGSAVTLLAGGLRGGGGPAISLEKRLPQLCWLKVLCGKCGIKDAVPMLQTEDWLFYQRVLWLEIVCGTLETDYLQLLPFKVRFSGAVKGAECVTKVAQCAKVHLVFCGARLAMDEFADAAKDDWLKGHWLCFEHSLGLKEWREQQVCCVKCALP